MLHREERDRSLRMLRLHPRSLLAVTRDLVGALIDLGRD